MARILAQCEVLQDYCTFLLSSKLDEFTNENIRLIKLPLNEEQFLLIKELQCRPFLKIISAGSEDLHLQLYHYLSRLSVFSISKQSFITFIPEFTNDIHAAISIINALEDLFEYISTQGNAKSTPISIHSFQNQNSSGAIGLSDQIDLTQTFIDNSSDRVIAFDRQMTIIAWNKTLESALGIKKEDAIGKNFYEIFPDYVGRIGYINEVWKGEKVILKEMPYLRSNGYYDAEIIPLFDGNNQVAGALCYSRTVTERIETRQKLFEQENFIKSIADASPSFIFLYDLDKKGFVYANHTLYNFFNMSEEEILNANVDFLRNSFYPEDSEKILDIIQKYNTGKDGEIFYTEHRNYNPKGDLFWFGTTTRILKRKKDGSIKQILGISVDITEKKKMESLLEEKTRIFQHILDSIPVLVFWKDKKNNLLGFNKAYQKALNRTAEELLTKTADELYPDAEKYLIDDYEVINSGNPKLNIIESVFTPEGIFWAKTDKVPLRGLNGEIIGIIGSAIDITELVKTQEALHNLNAELEKRVEERTQELLIKNNELVKINNDLDNFIYTASHDLKAPVSNIEGLIFALKEMFDEGTINIEEARYITEMIIKSITRFKTTIQDLTDISKAQKNLTNDNETIKIKITLDDLKELLKNEIIGSNAVIHADYVKCPEINFSIKNFRSIIFNLVNNAIKYRSSERNPIIYINTYFQGKYAVLEVRDNGLGIPNDQLDKVFGMFKRLHDHVEGSGVGLYIVKRIIDNAGGKIEVESQVGQGSTFRVYFPV
ncbi:MAG: PAS domain S-box protein [Cytophagaceae bacterium]